MTKLNFPKNVHEFGLHEIKRNHSSEPTLPHSDWVLRVGEGRGFIIEKRRRFSGLPAPRLESTLDELGRFHFCAYADPSYAIVAIASDAHGLVYPPTIITGVVTGTNLGNVELGAAVGWTVKTSNLERDCNNDSDPCQGDRVLTIDSDRPRWHYL